MLCSDAKRKPEISTEMSPVENTFSVMRTLGLLAFGSAPASVWRDDPVCATEFTAKLSGVVAPNDALHNAFLNSLLLAGRWALSAYPVFQLTHRLAATLMATTVSEEALEDVRCPFYGVTVKIPENLLFITDRDDQLEPVVLLTFAAYPIPNSAPVIDSKTGESRVEPTRWSYCLSTNPVPIGDGTTDALSVWSFHVAPKHLLDDDLPRHWNSLPRTSVDDRADMLARRLMLGLCLWCSDPKNLGEPKLYKSRSSERGRAGDLLPDFKTWHLGKDIKLDPNVIEAVRSFSREGGSSPKVQSLVSGHWKRQAHGPARSLRKLVHVEPYWRGPLDAPVISHGGGR